jgi:transcriptional regulator with XRE-family HTH domain
MTNFNQAFGVQVRRLREAAGLTQTELADRLNAGGGFSLHQPGIVRIEAGKRALRLGQAKLLADALNVPLTVLFEVDDPEEVALQEQRQHTLDTIAEHRKLIAIEEQQRADATKQIAAAQRQIANAELVITDSEHVIAGCEQRLTDYETKLADYQKKKGKKK